MRENNNSEALAHFVTNNQLMPSSDQKGNEKLENFPGRSQVGDRAGPVRWALPYPWPRGYVTFR
jgi:hypothetical protein